MANRMRKTKWSLQGCHYSSSPRASSPPVKHRKVHLAFLDTPIDIRRHVQLKLGAHDMRPEVGARILSALETGAAPNYSALLRAATFPDPPPIVFHTAPCAAHADIRREGLKLGLPGQSEHWKPLAGTPCATGFLDDQPLGVYVGPEPDLAGLWSHWSTWDVWAITLGELPWCHDEINPGCWAITCAVPATDLHLLTTKGMH